MSTSARERALRARSWLPGMLNRSPVLRSIFWLSADRVAQLFLTGFVSLVAARHYGPGDFGRLNYVLAFVTLLTPFSDFAQSLLVRDLSARAEDAHVLLGSASGISVAVSLSAAIGLATGGAMIAHDPTTRVLFVILASTLALRPAAVLDLWFQSRLQAKRAAFSRTVSIGLGAALRLTVVLCGWSVVAFAGVAVVETALTSLLYFVLYRAHGPKLRQWAFVRQEAFRLVRQSLPLVLAGLSIAIYTRTDQIILGSMLTPTDVGIYAAALRLSELTYFLPVVFVSSLTPGLSRLKVSDQSQYERALDLSAGFLLLVGLAIAVPIALFAHPLVNLLYGAHFARSGTVLTFHVLALPFVFIGVGQSIWTINENQQKLALVRTASGAVINAALNFVLIPVLGVVGPAVATIVAQAWSAWIANAFHPSSRGFFMLQTRQFALPATVKRVARDMHLLLHLGAET